MVQWFDDARKLNKMDWFSISFLVGALVVLALALVWIWTAAAHPSATGCHNPPPKMIRYPQWVGILISLAGVFLGRLTARAVYTSRRELNNRILFLGKQRPHARYALLTQAGLVGALLFITFLVAYVSVTLNAGVWPITYFMRCAAEAATWQTYIAAFFFCLLVGRWLWLPATPR
jgi:hypothetical protein